jgi:hypothetical protein
MVELVKHDEDNTWIILMTETETVQLKINGEPFGPVYTVGSQRQATLTLRVEETDVPTP